MPINDRDIHPESDFCECDNYQAEKIPHWNCTQCAYCGRPSYDEVMSWRIARSISRHPAGAQQHRST